MSSYTDELEISYHATASELFDTEYWVVKSQFRYYIGEEGSNEWVDIPAGFLTDGASVPRLFWNLIPPWGRYGQATVVHDYLCEHGKIVRDGEPVPITRKKTDKIFKEAMQVLQVPAWKVWAMSTAVNMYRKVTRQVKPKLPERKEIIEQMIRNNSLTSKKYELNERQISFIKTMGDKNVR